MSNRISFKLRKSVSTSGSAEIVLERIGQIPNIGKIERIFHDAADNSELAGFFTMEEIEPSALKQVLEKLKQDPDVEYAYEPPTRKTSI